MAFEDKHYADAAILGLVSQESRLDFAEDAGTSSDVVTRSSTDHDKAWNTDIDLDWSAWDAYHGCASDMAYWPFSDSTNDLTSSDTSPTFLPRPLPSEDGSLSNDLAEGTRFSEMPWLEPRQRRTHKCTVLGCGKSYSHKGDLRRHEREKHLGEVYYCPVDGCSEQFKRQYRLITHLTNPRGSYGSRHPLVPTKALAEILVYESHYEDPQNVIVFDDEGQRTVVVEKIEENDVVGRGPFRVHRKYLKFFLCFTCPFAECQLSEPKLLFFRAQCATERCIYKHLLNHHELESIEAEKSARQTEANALDCARMAAEQE